jgi:hypothetical protein
MPGDNPTISPNNTNPTSGYRFYNVRKEERKDADNSLKEKAAGAVNTGAKVTGTTMQATGTAVQAAGVGMQVAGTATKAAGAGVTAVGMGLSATGVGAVVGAPIAAAGRIVGVGGSAIKAGGKVTSKAGKTIRKAGSGVKRVGARVRQTAKTAITAAKILAPVQTTLINILFSVGLASIWILQVLAVFLSFGFLALASGLSFGANYSEFVGSVLGWIADAVQSVTGFNLNLAEHMGSVFMFFHVMAFLVGITSLFIVALRSIFTFKSPFWGDGAVIKVVVFLTAVVALYFPISNLLPWAIIWSWVIDNTDS